MKLTQKQRYNLYDRASEEVYVDFDGTLCEWRYPDLGPPVRGARLFMQTLQLQGLKPVIWTCRLNRHYNTDEEWDAMYHRLLRWLQQYSIPYHRIEQRHDKPLCLAYVDDRGIGYRGNWGPITTRVRQLKELHKQRMESRNEMGSGD